MIFSLVIREQRRETTFDELLSDYLLEKVKDHFRTDPLANKKIRGNKIFCILFSYEISIGTQHTTERSWALVRCQKRRHARNVSAERRSGFASSDYASSSMRQMYGARGL